jgi:Protein of unknown function (DUF3987)
MYAYSNESNYRPNLKETIVWLQALNRPPLPECPIQAATQGRESKSPHYIDGKRVVSIQWKAWQSIMPPQETLNIWFQDKRMGIGTLGGWNGKHWLCWIDIDQKTFPSQPECDRITSEWEAKYNLFLEQAPVFRTPNGGYRYLVAFSEKPEGFGANNGFSFSPSGDTHSGELLIDKGHTLLPPTIGLNQKPYEWVRWFEYPPVVSCPGDVGLYPYVKTVQKTSTESECKNSNSRTNFSSSADTSISDFLINEVYPRLTLEQCFNDPCHDFKEYDGGLKLKGNCPWHDSSSGTAFYCRVDNGIPCYECPVDGKGNVIQYRHRLVHGVGASSPRGGEFIEIAKQLAADAGVLDRFPSLGSLGNSSQKSSPAQSLEVKDSSQNQAQEIDKLISLNLSTSALILEFAKLAKEHKVSVPVIEKAYNEKVRENELEDNSSLNYQQFEFLQAVERDSIDIAEIIPKALAQPMKKLASGLNLRPESYLTTTLCTASSLMSVGTEAMLVEMTDFTVTPNLFAGILAEPSQRKSPILSATISKPLSKLKQETNEKYLEETNQYKRDCNDYKNMSLSDRRDKFGDSEPEKPIQRIYSFSKSTGEGIISRANAYPTKIPLFCSDELSSIFKSSNAYRGGKGSDEEDFLSMYDGGSICVLRADGIRASVDSLPLSMCGGIQPGVLETLLNGCNDSNGLWSRFIFVNQPSVPCFLGEDTGSLNITPMLAALYKNIDILKPTLYKLDSDAKKYFIKTYNELEQLRVSATTPGMEMYWGKTAGRIGKLALNIHIIKHAFEGVYPPLDIPLETVMAAKKLAYFYANQVMAMYIKLSDSDAAAPNLDRILKIAAKKGTGNWITATDVNIGKKSKYRTPTSQVREWFNQLEKLGKGETKVERGVLKFRLASNGGMGTVGTKMGTVPIFQTHTEQDFQDKMGKMGTMGTKKIDIENLENKGTTDDQKESDPEEVPIVPILPILSGNPDPDSVSRMGTSMGTFDKMGTFLEIGNTVEVFDDPNAESNKQGLVGTITYVYEDTGSVCVAFEATEDRSAGATMLKPSQLRKVADAAARKH